jgi:hypothetical protein
MPQGRASWTGHPTAHYIVGMHATGPIRFLSRVPRDVGCLLSRIARIGIAFSLVLSLLGVHSALAHADAPGVPGIASLVFATDHPDADHPDAAHPDADHPDADHPDAAHPDAAHPDAAMALEQAAHLAGHLTGVVSPSALCVVTIDATRTRQPILADALPRSTILPAPSEPPRS